MQINASGEISSQPYVPLFELIGEHLRNVKAIGVRDAMLTWTVGGCPSPITQFACEFLDSEQPLEEALCAFFEKKYGASAAVVAAADKQFCAAYREYPFHINMIYNGPHTFGPMAPFFEKPTGCKSTMVGFPYDDIDGYRACYPREILEQQFHILSEEWKKGIEILEAHTDPSAEYAELCLMARAAYCHFASAYNHTHFVNCRDNGDKAGMKEAILAEQAVVRETIDVRSKDSRIGFEASNQYYYSMQDLAEKQLNLAYLLERC